MKLGALMAMTAMGLGGCNGGYVWRIAEPVQHVVVSLIPTDDPKGACKQVMNNAGGCAMWQTINGIRVCVIIARVDDHDIIAHEALHCLGRQHQ